MSKYVLILLFMFSNSLHAGWDSYQQQYKSRQIESKAIYIENLYNKARYKAFDLENRLQHEQKNNQTLKSEIESLKRKNNELTVENKSLNKSINECRNNPSASSGKADLIGQDSNITIKPEFKDTTSNKEK